MVVTVDQSIEYYTYTTLQVCYSAKKCKQAPLATLSIAIRTSIPISDAGNFSLTVGFCEGRLSSSSDGGAYCRALEISYSYDSWITLTSFDDTFRSLILIFLKVLHKQSAQLGYFLLEIRLPSPGLCRVEEIIRDACA